MTKVWKVFRRLPGSSDLYSISECSARLTFEEGKETRPKAGEGLIFAFESYEAVRAFRVCGDEVWECMAVSPRPCRWRAAHENLTTIRKLFWEFLSPREFDSQYRPKSLQRLDFYSKREGEVVATTPPGTVVCEAVTPMARVG